LGAIEDAVPALPELLQALRVYLAKEFRRILGLSPLSEMEWQAL